MLTYARLRDHLVKRTGLRRDAAAHVLDEIELAVARELAQQGEVVFRGLFRITPVVQRYCTRPRKQDPMDALRGEPPPARAYVSRIVLKLRPMRSLRRKLNEIPLPG